jgi:hypothetical protein
MRTTLKGVLIGIVFLAAAGQAFAYPPDNAAVLYYKACMIMEEPNDAVEKMLRQLSKDDSRVNEQVRLCLESNREVIREIVTAAQIKNCDWGYDFSQGAFMLLPHLKKFRDAACLLAADAKILAEKGNYKTAIERCITIHKMGIHLGDDFLISRLVGNAIGTLANKCIVEILPQVSNDTETLQWLRTQLADVSSRYPSIGATVRKDAGIWSNSINREGILEVVRNSGLSKNDLDKAEQVIRQNDNNEFYVRIIEYYKHITSRIQIAYDLPYPQAKQVLGDLYKEVKDTAKEKPEAAITEVLLPVINRALTVDTRERTRLNAVRAGIEIYIIRAKTGKLPDELPAGLPKDMFSGKDFLYEKTDAGFILTGQGKDLDDDIIGFVLNSQGKDLDKDIVQKYEFKVAK